MGSRILRILFSLFESAIRNIGGGIGQRIRYIYYSSRFRSCGKNVRIDEGVIIQNPESIEVGNNVWILPYTIITGRGKDSIPGNRIIRVRNVGVKDGLENPSNCLLTIGDQTSIGAFNIIHGYGGLGIGERVTTSARVSIYSFSHTPSDTENPDVVTYANSMVDDAPVACIISPITIGDGVWLGLGTSVFAGNLGENSFVSAHSVVTGDLEKNSYARGIPAKKIRERFT